MGDSQSKSGNQKQIHKMDQTELDALIKSLLSEGSSYSTRISKLTQFNNVLDCIINRQGSPYGEETSREDAIEPFMQWCKDNCIYSKGINIQGFEESGAGLVASEVIQPEEMVIGVPYKTMVNSLDAAGQFGDLVKAAGIDAVWLQVPVALKLCHERALREKSQWKAYIDMLPKYMPHPVYMNAQDYSYLVGSPCYEEGISLFYEIALQYGKLYTALMKQLKNGEQYGALRPETFTFEAYRWGMAIALTRSLKVTNEAGEAVTVLVPFWDLCNHGEEFLYTKVDFNPTGEGEIPALYAHAYRQISPGEQLHICYRESSTPVEFFSIWGLALVDYFSPVKVKISALDRNADAKKTYLKQLSHLLPNVVDNAVELKLYGDTWPLTAEDLQALLIISATTSDVKNATISQETWSRVWNHVIKRINRRLDGYTATIPDNLDDIGPQAALAIRQVAAEKSVLQKALDHSLALASQDPTIYGFHDLVFLSEDQESTAQQISEHTKDSTAVGQGDLPIAVA